MYYDALADTSMQFVHQRMIEIMHLNKLNMDLYKRQ